MRCCVDEDDVNSCIIRACRCMAATCSAKNACGTMELFRGTSCMPTVNSFGTRTALCGRRPHRTRSSACRRSKRAGFPGIARLPFSLKILLENLLRHEDGRFVKAGRHRGARALGREEHGAEGNLVHAGARAAAGLHRRARASSISRRCATASSRLGGDPEQGQPAAAGRARHRSLGAGRLLRPAPTPSS